MGRLSKRRALLNAAIWSQRPLGKISSTWKTTTQLVVPWPPHQPIGHARVQTETTKTEFQKSRVLGWMRLGVPKRGPETDPACDVTWNHQQHPQPYSACRISCTSCIIVIDCLATCSARDAEDFRIPSLRDDVPLNSLCSDFSSSLVAHHVGCKEVVATRNGVLRWRWAPET